MAMARLRLLTRMPIWVRVTGIVALVLVAVVVGAMLLGDSGETARGGSGGHGSGAGVRQTNHDARQPGDHGARARTETMDH
jgi:hypothetical protein